MSHNVIIAHLYPREMNIYGDMGNITALVKRLEWRGYRAEVRPVEIGESFDLAAADLVFGGGGQDSGQLLVGADLLKRGEELRAMAAAGVPMLTICGTYQLFGRGFTTLDGREIPGIDIFHASTLGSTVRMIGNIVIDSPWGRLVGFENHSGQTMLEPDQAPLGTVRKGFGNNAKSGREGAVTGNAVGTYLHGPILPKNPALTDHLLLAALNRRHTVTELEPLDDSLEQEAAKAAARRPQ
jgi:CobQ-like glutamine amidotransferase family enzyme